MKWLTLSYRSKDLILFQYCMKKKKTVRRAFYKITITLVTFWLCSNLENHTKEFGICFLAQKFLFFFSSVFFCRKDSTYNVVVNRKLFSCLIIQFRSYINFKLFSKVRAMLVFSWVTPVRSEHKDVNLNFQIWNIAIWVWVFVLITLCWCRYPFFSTSTSTCGVPL